MSYRTMNPPPARRADYDALVKDRLVSGSRERIAFCVYTDDLDEGRGDIYVAAGLALELAELGFGVRLVPRSRWMKVDADVVVAMMPTFDPSWVRPGVRTVAWVRNEVERWCATGNLPSYDLVFGSSGLVVQRLSKQTDRVHPEPLPIGADPHLFTAPSTAGAERSSTAITTANFWGSLRDVHKVLMDLPRRADVRMYGVAHNAPLRLRRWVEGSRSYFELPELYRTHAFVIDDVNSVNIGFGALNSRLYESGACGALPIVNTRLSLAEQGFGHLPTYRDSRELASVLEGLRADPQRARALADLTRGTVLERHTWADRAKAFTAALDAHTEPAPPAPTMVHYFPRYARNPFQDMLFGALVPHGLDPRYTGDDLFGFLRSRIEGNGPMGVLNLSWTDPIVQPSRGPFAARNRLDEMTALIHEYRRRGGRLVWTVHNVLPHEGRHRWAEIELAQMLADASDAVHLLSAETIAAAAPYFTIDPAKAVVIEHSSYDGRYPTWVSRETARERLGLAPQHKAIIALGGVRPYKGLDRLVVAFDELHAEDPDLRLLIAGRPGKVARSAKFEMDCLADPRIIAHFDYVPDDELQVWMGAADLAVLAYRAILNSGSFLLSQSFGLPAVVPRAGALAGFESEVQVEAFDPDDDAGLTTAMRRAVAAHVVDHDGRVRARDAALRLAAERSPERMAEEFAQLVGTVIER